MRYVLFVCTHNAGRSQMARAFFERDAPPDLRAESAGTDPAREIWPPVVEAMAEVGIDPSGRRPQKLSLEMQGSRSPTCAQSATGSRARSGELVDYRLDAIYADRTAHQLRLTSILPGLAAEFAGRHTDEEIRACADAILDRYDDVPVRSYITTLVARQARECLQGETCEAVTAP